MSAGIGSETDYLCVDEFLRDAVSARALASAFELGLIDLMQARACTAPELGAHGKLDRAGLMLLTDMLRASYVVEESAGRFQLTQGFLGALQYRDLLEAKLDFAATVSPDFFHLFTTLLTDPAGYFGKAKLFDLFSYDRCFESNPENIARTAQWMRFTTVLTRYEARACLRAHDFSGYKRMLDVGGNSGEFALHVCREHGGLQATVYDLPVVCEIGEKHLRAEPEASRIRFARVPKEGGPMPGGHDLVTFKSMLHDWPDDPMQQFLQRAHDALAPGGTVLIFERGVVDFGEHQIPYGQIPIVLFFRSYRVPASYSTALKQAGFRDIEVAVINLDMPFMLVTARK